MVNTKNSILISLVIFLVFISGCINKSSQEVNMSSRGFDVESMDLLDNNLETLLLNSTKLEFGETIDDIKITDISIEENSYFVTYLFKKDTTNYLAIMYTEKSSQGIFKLGFVDGTKVTNNDPVTIYNIVGETISQKLKKRIHIVMGYVNDENVDIVYVSYPNGQVSGIKFNETKKTYTEIAIGIFENPISVKAVSKDEKVLLEKIY